jgi:uncharacterized protein YjbI with pentapeptide repeats
LYRANFADCRLCRVNFRASPERDGFITDLTGASFRGADLSYADLRGAILEDVDLTGADLTGTLF